MKPEIRIPCSDPMARAGAPHTPRAAPRFAAVAALAVLLSIAGVACLGWSPETDDPALSDPQLRAARIEELKQAIERDHATLEDLITRPVDNDAPLYDDPEMRAIAGRLNEQVRTLERLEAAAK